MQQALDIMNADALLLKSILLQQFLRLVRTGIGSKLLQFPSPFIVILINVVGTRSY
jgi:hypothetical protein